MLHVCTVPLPDPETLQQLQLPIVSENVCKEKYPELTDNMLCAGDMSGGKGPCKVSVEPMVKTIHICLYFFNLSEL